MPEPSWLCSDLLASHFSETGTVNRPLRAEVEGKMTIRVLIILATVCFSANAMPQALLPKVGHKPLVQVKPKAPEGCKLVGTVKGTKLWAGNCAAASELRGTTPTGEPAAPDPAVEADPPAAKQ